MIYKTPQKHNSAIKTTLTNGIRKLLARRKYSSVKPLVLKEALEYHQKINDIEIKRIFCEDLAKMQKVLPVITMDIGSMLRVKKVLSKHGFALMHMSDGMYISTTLMHKAGFSMSTKVGLGKLNAKHCNIINLLNLSVNMDETPDNKETDANGMPYKGIKHDIKEYTYQDQFMEALRFAVDNGQGIKYKFGEPLDTLENAYSGFVQMKEQGISDWDECIEEYEYAFYESVFIDAIEKALKDGHGVKHKFGHYEQTLESYYMTILIEKAKGSKEYDGCIEAYEEAFFESIFMNAVKQAVDNGEGVKYKFGFDNRTLEQWHNSMLIDKGHGAVKWNAYITAYDDAFNCKGSHDGDKVKTDTEPKRKDLIGEYFIDAIKKAIENGEGIKYKCGEPLDTLENRYKDTMRMKRVTGGHHWDTYIKAYEEAFFESVFIDAVEQAIYNGEGIKQKFGFSKQTLEYAYNEMSGLEEGTSQKWATCIKAYEDAFYDQSTGKFKGEEEYPDVKGHDSDETEDKKKALAKAKAEQEAQAAKDKEDARIKAEEEAIAKAAAEDKKKAEAKAAKAKAIKDKEDAEERATINALIDKVEFLCKDGKYKYAEHDTYEPPETFEYRVARQGLISFYKEMLNEQEAGSDKWNLSIQKYQDVFTEHAFITMLKRTKKNSQGLNYKFGTRQNRLEDVYKGMLTVQANDEDEWDECIEKYRETYFDTAFMHAIKLAKMNGMGIKYMWVKDKKSLEQMYKEMRVNQNKGKKQWNKYIQSYESNFGYSKNLIK